MLGRLPTLDTLPGLVAATKQTINPDSFFTQGKASGQQSFSAETQQECSRERRKNGVNLHQEGHYNSDYCCGEQ